MCWTVGQAGIQNWGSAWAGVFEPITGGGNCSCRWPKDSRRAISPYLRDPDTGAPKIPEKGQQAELRPRRSPRPRGAPRFYAGARENGPGPGLVYNMGTSGGAQRGRPMFSDAAERRSVTVRRSHGPGVTSLHRVVVEPRGGMATKAAIFSRAPPGIQGAGQRASPQFGLATPSAAGSVRESKAQFNGPGWPEHLVEGAIRVEGWVLVVEPAGRLCAWAQVQARLALY